MEKNAVLGEILYIGLVCEKGRVKSGGIWKRSYVRSHEIHLQLLREITECMQKPYQAAEDNIFLKNICREIMSDEIFKKHYTYCKLEDVIESDKDIITECREENKHIEIAYFMNQLFEDILLELNKGIRKNKEKIIRMIFAAHNLPRAYLSKGAGTLFLIEEFGVSPKVALEYAELSMNESMILNYNWREIKKKISEEQ